MAEIARLAEPGNKLVVLTTHHRVDHNDPCATQAVNEWRADLTARGGEGMVVKLLGFVSRGRKGLVQPAIKCRGLEYLRIIYGPRVRRVGASGRGVLEP
jgi:hypothetical protein